MTLGEILEKIAEDDKAGGKKHDLSYQEYVKDGHFRIKLSSGTDKDAYLQCSVPDNGLEEEKNYLRSYFLSMVFNAAIYGMKRKKSIKNSN
jgi:hypothetical protein